MLIKDVIDSHENSDMKIPHIDLDVMKNLGNNCYVVSDDSQETIMLDINQKESVYAIYAKKHSIINQVSGFTYVMCI